MKKKRRRMRRKAAAEMEREARVRNVPRVCLSLLGMGCSHRQLRYVLLHIYFQCVCMDICKMKVKID